MQNHFTINRPILDIITSSAIQYEPHSINVCAVKFFCIFGVQKFPSLKICLNKFPLIKLGYNRNCIIKLKRNGLHFMTDMLKLVPHICLQQKLTIHPLHSEEKMTKQCNSNDSTNYLMSKNKHFLHSSSFIGTYFI